MSASILKPRPRKSIWPSPVYEAHYDSGDFVRMSFWSAKGKPIDHSKIEAQLAKRAPACIRRAEGEPTMISGFVRHNGQRYQVFPMAEVVEMPKPKRISAKMARETLGKLLACLDGDTTDREAIRQAVLEARQIAA